MVAGYRTAYLCIQVWEKQIEGEKERKRKRKKEKKEKKKNE